MRLAAAVLLGTALPLAPAAAPAAGLPPEPSHALPADAGQAVAALVRLGLDPDEAVARVSRLDPDERRRLSEAGDALGVGGGHRETLGIAVGIVVLLVLLLAL